jgi:hypothetical protein
MQGVRVVIKILVLYNNVVMNKLQTQIVNLSDEATFGDLLLNLGLYPPGTEVDLSRYYWYSDSSFSYTSGSHLPFVLVEGVVEWSPPFVKVKVRDFLTTHNIQNGEIHLLTGFPQAGGAGLVQIATQWDRFYPIVEQIVTGAGFLGLVYGAGKMAVTTGKWLAGKIHSKKSDSLGLQNVLPGSVVALVFSCTRWSARGLSAKAKIDEADAKGLLRLFMYKWDRKVQMYVKTEESGVVLERLRRRSSEYSIPH